MSAVWITGIGLASSLGAGAEAHLAASAPVVDAASHAPFPLHPLPALPYETQIPRRDFRQMETWQRLGVLAAGLALDDANARPLGEHIDLTVAAHAGERDIALDEQLFAEVKGLPFAEAAPLLNQRMMAALRPTLFLAELPNLLAGSITIVHGVARSSRTLMGEEIAGAEALRLAMRRILQGESAIALVGAAHNPDRWEEMLTYAAGGLLWRGEWRPVAERAAAGGGFCFGGVGAFLVLESAAHARARGAAPIAQLSALHTAMAHRRGNDTAAASGAALLAQLQPRLRAGAAALSTASGAAGVTADELALLRGAGLAPQCLGDLLGHAPEASFPAAIALAALRTRAGGAAQTLVSGFGPWRGEAMALVEAA